MLTKQESVDKFGGVVINYQLTQGDSFPLTISVKDDAGELISQSLIASVTFKLGNSDRQEVYSQEFEALENGKYKLVVSKDDTAKLEEGKYFYEIEVLFSDEYNTTPLSYTSTLQILPQIQ